jgi:hypothetical protein
MLTTRRFFLSQATTTLLLIPIVGVAVHCGSSSTGSTPAPAGTAPPAGATDITTVSTSATDPIGPHTHSVTVLSMDLSSPPAAGVIYTSTTVNTHAHTIMLSSAMLTSIEAGTPVTVTSSSTGHTHDFMIKKA